MTKRNKDGYKVLTCEDFLKSSWKDEQVWFLSCGFVSTFPDLFGANRCDSNYDVEEVLKKVGVLKGEDSESETCELTITCTTYSQVCAFVDRFNRWAGLVRDQDKKGYPWPKLEIP